MRETPMLGMKVERPQLAGTREVTATSTEVEEAAARFPTIASIVQAANQTLPPELWDHSSGGVEFETTLRRNRFAFDRIGFRPRRMRDVRGRTAETTFLGHTLRMPVFLAPVGSIHHYAPEGALSAARAAERFGTLQFLSTEAPPGLPAIREGGAKTPIVYQLYVFGDREWIVDRVKQVEENGAIGLCFTADAPVSGNRDRNRRNRFVSRTEDIPYHYREHFTWDDFDWLRSITKLPMIIKGLASPEDANLAVEHGADVVYVSNHGGRQLDHLPGAIETLPEMVAAVAGRAKVVFDSGILRGSDVVKAIALGADAVGIGKLQVWSLAAGGEGGLEWALELLRTEILSVMGLLGVRSLAELTPELLCDIAPAPLTEWVGFQPSR